MKKIKTLSEKEKEDLLREARLEIMKERAMTEIGASAKNPGRIKELRKVIARILTLKGGKEKK